MAYERVAVLSEKTSYNLKIDISMAAIENRFY